MTDAQTVATNYIATWNETDDARRSILIARDWSETPHYVAPLMAASTATELCGLIGAVQDRFPGFVFRLIDAPDGHGNYVRFRWGFGPQGNEAVIEGSDMVETTNGRIDRVVGFLDKMPPI